jgi:protein-tyrosine sulfotransferase
MNKDASYPPAFILSPARSGSTLLRYIIDTHPAFGSPPELNLGRVCETLYRALYHTGAHTSSATEKEQIICREIRNIIYGFMSTYAAAKGKPNWCEKSPDNLFHLPVLYNVFPDAKYLCLYRNCMDLVHSLMEYNRLQLFEEVIYFVQKNTGNMVDAMIDYWITQTRATLTFEREHSAQCFHVKYESIVREPVPTLEAMFSFLGVEWDEKLLDSVFSTQREVAGGDHKILFSDRIHPTSLGKGSTISRKLISAEMLERMNALLEELEYPVVGPDWDTSPSPFSVLEATEQQEDEVASVREVFENVFPKRIQKQEHALRGTHATCQITVTGEESGTWLVNLSESNSRITSADEQADCLVQVASSDLLDIVNGKLDVVTAMQQGKLQVAGGERIAMMLARVLFGTLVA